MSGSFSPEPMLDMYIFETTQLIEQLEQIIISSEKCDSFTIDDINEIFRVMHTIKGSSAMMLFDNITTLTHSIEDLFYFLREEKHENIDCSKLSDIILEGVDFIKTEVEKIVAGKKPDGDASILVDNIKGFLSDLMKGNQLSDIITKDNESGQAMEKQKFNIDSVVSDKTKNAFRAAIFFEEGCQMENIRAYGIIDNLREFTEEISYVPEDVLENDSCIEAICNEGFIIYFSTNKSYDEVYGVLKQTPLLRDLELIKLEANQEFKQSHQNDQAVKKESNAEAQQLNFKEGDDNKKDVQPSLPHQTIISVNVEKLDRLMDLMGEIVIAEAMVTQNPDIEGLELDNFQKAARQLHKITSELQDMVMSIRMVPLSATFHKMHRIVRDMGKKLDKEVRLKLIGEETEVDKNIIEHISDPLMHLVRNAIDHGLEGGRDREKSGKSKTGTVTLEAKNAGSDVLIIVRDDGKGLNRGKILERAKENNLLTKSEQELTDKEIYNLIFLPGFSTKDEVSEFSGRGVGMDVVVKNIESVGGSVSVESDEGIGTTIILTIPITLAIIDGMNISVGISRYTIPTTAIKESFRPKANDLIKDPDGNEMIMVRGQCYPVIRLHELYKVKTEITDFIEGILIMVEQDGENACIFADGLLGQQQVVVKALPGYIKRIRKIEGIAGCTLLGDGSISLILDVGGIVHRG